MIHYSSSRSLVIPLDNETPYMNSFQSKKCLLINKNICSEKKKNSFLMFELINTLNC